MPIGSGREELGRHQGPVGNSDGQSRERTGDESANGKTSLIWRFRILIFILYTPLHAPLVDDSWFIVHPKHALSRCRFVIYLKRRSHLVIPVHHMVLNTPNYLAFPVHLAISFHHIS